MLSRVASSPPPTAAPIRSSCRRLDRFEFFIATPRRNCTPAGSGMCAADAGLEGWVQRPGLLYGLTWLLPLHSGYAPGLTYWISIAIKHGIQDHDRSEAVPQAKLH